MMSAFRRWREYRRQKAEDRIEEAVQRAEHTFDIEHQGIGMLLEGRPIRYLMPEETPYGFFVLGSGFNDIEDDDFRQRPNIRRILRPWSPTSWRYGYVLLYWSDGTDLEALDAKVLAGEATDDDFATAVAVKPQGITCLDCGHRFRGFVSESQEPATWYTTKERRALNSHMKVCHLCQAPIFTLFVVEQFEVTDSPLNKYSSPSQEPNTEQEQKTLERSEHAALVETIGTSATVGKWPVHYLTPDDSLGEFTPDNVNDAEDDYFRQRTNVRRILRRRSPKHSEHSYALLYWSDGTDLTALDAKVLSDDTTADDFENTIGLEPETVTCPHCKVEFRALVHKPLEAVFFGMNVKRRHVHPHQEKCHVCNKSLGDTWVVGRFDIPRTGSDSN
jgi:hypothetical protein